MRLLLLCVVALFTLAPGAALYAQIATDETSESQEPSPGFPGTYLFEWQDGRSVAAVELEGTTFRARVATSGGYVFGLVGTAAGSHASGTIVGKSGTGEFGEFEASIEGDVLSLDLNLRPAPDQEPEPLSITFSRIDADSDESVAQESAPPESATPPSVAESPVQVPGGAAGDPRLVATWVYQSLVTSGDASYASEQFFDLLADGRYAFGRGSTVAGGAGWSYNGGEGDGETERGFWRAAEGILYLLDENGQWKRIGKYGMTEDGSTMRITYDSGGKKLWSRR